MTKNREGHIDFAFGGVMRAPWIIKEEDENPQALKNDDEADKENKNVRFPGRGKPTLRSELNRFVSIASLTPFMNKWTIKNNTNS